MTEKNNDDWWFAEQEYLYVPYTHKYFKNNGIKSRHEWNIICQHIIKGATYNLNFSDTKPNLRKTKGYGGTTDMNIIRNDKEYCNEKNEYSKYVPQRFDMEDLFSFSYEDMINEKPNKRFNNLKNLVFNHDFDDEEKQAEYDRFVERYNSMMKDGSIDIVDDIYKRLSSYMKRNKISSKWVDGSVICNIAVMIAEYVNTGIFKYDYDFINNIKSYNENEDFRFHLFLILQCFTSKNIYYKQYISGKYIRNWWAICHLRHRYSDLDMKTKGQCCGFKDTNGKYIFKIY